MLTNVTFRVPRDVDTRTQDFLWKLPFKHKPPVQAPQKSKTMEQMREGMDDAGWNRYMGEVVLRKLQYKKKPSTVDRSWAKEHSDLFYDVMQQYTAQQRWHKLELPPSQKQWVEAQKDRGDPSTLAALVDVVLDNMGNEIDGEQPALSSVATGTKREGRGGIPVGTGYCIGGAGEKPPNPPPPPTGQALP